MRASRKSEGKCAERSEGNLAEGEPEGREAVARGRGSFAAASLPSSGPASVRDPWPSVGKENQSKAKSAAVKRLVRGRLQEVPWCDTRPRQNCLSEAAMKI